MTKIKTGILGFGNMGRMYYRCLIELDCCEVIAVCDSNPSLIEDSNKPAGNISGVAEHIDFSKFKLYTDFEKMLAETGLDALFITLPSFLHADFTEKALQAGIHVLCEKPMALTLDDCDRMISAQNQSGKILQIGHCIRFWPEYAKTKEIIDSGKYGKVLSASFSRLTNLPQWGPGDQNWFIDDSKSGGMALDLHIHDTDYIQYLFGPPQAVHSYSLPLSSGGMGYIHTRYLYEQEMAVTAEGSWLVTDSFGFVMSFLIMLDKATVFFNSKENPSYKIYPSEEEHYTPELENGDGYSREITYFLDKINNNDMVEIITPAQSRESIRIVQAEKESSLKKSKISLV